jgi:uncharacterized protein YyaL (SSP411 family)
MSLENRVPLPAAPARQEFPGTRGLTEPASSRDRGNDLHSGEFSDFRESLPQAAVTGMAPINREQAALGGDLPASAAARAAEYAAARAVRPKVSPVKQADANLPVMERPMVVAKQPGRGHKAADAQQTMHSQQTARPYQPGPPLFAAVPAGRSPAAKPTAMQPARQQPAPRQSNSFRSAGWTLTAIAGMILASVGGSLAEGDSDPAPTGETKGGKQLNRLSRETSPYLLGHAHNPVDWYPWGPEALEKARKENKLIFLSIGYSSCHWCHVMEKKVFSNPEIARYMNEHFVNIKVDREERPDIDDIYMTALQQYYVLLRSPQSGGWPLSIFLTPDALPIGGGTYFPPEDDNGRVGFPSVLRQAVESWRDKREDMEKSATIIANAVKKMAKPRANLEPVKLERTRIEPVLKSLAEGYDAEFGGFGFSAKTPDRPKFPVPTRLALLQYEAKRHANEPAGKMLYNTLDKMAAGGIYDHAGGGFHRYSTDRFWRVPHFEKMLYDNAQLADVYAEAYRHTNQRHYRQVAEETIEFVLRELRDPGGAFYSALDADSEGVEGKFYVWTDNELEKVLSAEELTVCNVVYGTGGKQNFELGHVLEMKQSLDAAAKKLKLPALQVERRIADINKKLLAVRQQRRKPARDDKVLTAWNGLMIRTLARAGVIFQKPEYVQAAEKAAEFILNEMRDKQGGLYHSYAVKQAKFNAYLDDYAYVTEGLLALHLATNDEKWAIAAQRLCDMQLAMFWDEEGNGCFFTSHEHEALLARMKNAYDSVLPSGNSVTARNLLRLASFSKQASYRNRARQTLELFAPFVDDYPLGLTNMALALDEYLDTDDPAVGSRPAPRAKVGISPDAAVVLANGQEADGPRQAIQVSDKSTDKSAGKTAVVTGQAYLSVDRLPAGKTCKVLVQLQIAEGWHIHANPAGDPDIDLPTELELDSKLGIELTKIVYPAGKNVERGDDEKPQSLYMGKVNLIGQLEVPATAAGRREELTVTVAFQACNDAQCLPPKKLKLTVPVTVAKADEPVKQINEAMFAPPAKKEAPKKKTAK